MKFLLKNASVTADSALLVYEYFDNAEYKIYVDGECIATTDKPDYTVTGLKGGTVYKMQVEAVGISKTDVTEIQTQSVGEVINVEDFGAVGDGKTLNTESIQRAFDSCPPGGTVVIPKGVFVSGALFLKSDMTLHIEDGAKLLGSCDTRDYPVFKYRFEGREQMCYASLVNTQCCSERLRNIKITGNGTIDASGVALFMAEMSEKKGARGRAVCVRNTDGVYIKDITVRQSPSWCLHTIYCNDVVVNNVKIHTKFDENGERYPHIFNGDGFDPDSCRNVAVVGSMIASQDDCIAVKSGRDEEGRTVGIASENILIQNCSFKSGFGVGVGSEMSGGVRNVHIEACTFENTYSLGMIKAPRGRGGVVENVVYKNCTHYYNENEFSDNKWFRGAINIDQFYSVENVSVNDCEPFDEGTPIFRNIRMENISVDTTAGNAVFVAGLPESPIENITLKNVTAKGRFGIKVYNVKNLNIENVSVMADEGEDFVTFNVR